MTLPDQPGGSSISPDLTFGVSGNDGSISGLNQLTQDFVTPILKAQLLASPAYNNSSTSVFAGLRSGISLPLAIIEAIVQAFGFGSLFGSNADALGALSSLGNLIGGFLSGGPIPIGWLTSLISNLLANPNFLTAASIGNGGPFSWDGSVFAPGSSGSAKTTGDSSTKSLFSNPVKVAEGDQLATSIQTMWSSATGSGIPIELNIAKYLDGSLVGYQNIASISSLPFSSSWQTLAGNFTVPAGVDMVKMKPTVASGLTGGSVWFSGGSLAKTGLIQEGWVSGLTDFITGIFTAFGVGDVGQLFNVFTNLLKIFNLGSATPLLGAPGSFDPTTILTSFVTGNINPLGLLAPLVGGQVPNANAPQLVQDILDAGTNVLSGIINNTTGNPIANFFQGLQGVQATGSSAQAVNVIQDAQLAAVAVGGGAVSNSETFDGSAGALNTTLWEQTYGYGAGAGTDGYDGSGKCHWTGSGTANYGCLNRHKTATNTDTQLVQVQTTSDMGGSTTGNQPSIRLQGRMNSARTNYVEARITTGSAAEIGIVVSGTYTRLGAATSTGGIPSSGTWTLKVGTTASTREFVLLHDGATVLSRTDTGATSVIGASNRFTAFSHIAGSSFYFVNFQVPPPDIESFGSSDRLAAS